MHDERTLKFLVDIFGANKIALGSDYPFPLGENIPGKLVKNSNLDEMSKEWLLNKSALEWLSLKHDLFV